jgi:hypothetical protein
MGRFSLASVLWIVALIALGFAALRDASNFWLGATFVVTLGLLCASVLGAVIERNRGGSWWLGFAVFGWAYLVAGLIPPFDKTARVPSRWVAQQVFVASHRNPFTAPMGGGNPVGLTQQAYGMRIINVAQIGHWIFVLIFARAGATVSCLFTKGLPWRKRPASDPTPIPSPIP